MSERLELRHVEHLMDVCGDSHDGLMLLGTMAVVANVIKQRDAAERANATPLVRCDDCGFGYSAEHSNADGSYSCPLCEVASLTARAVRAEQPLTELQTLVTAFVRDYGRCGDWDEDSLVAGRFFADAVNLLGKLSTSAATP